MQTKKQSFWRLLYKLHRYIGLVSALIFLMLAITGIALNHTEDLKLKSQMIQAPLLLDWYGIESPNKLRSFATTHHWLTQIDQQLYFDQSLLKTTKEPLLGAVESDEFIVAAFSHSLILLTLQGDLIEQTSLNDIKKIGRSPLQSIVIKTGKGTFVSEDNLLSWKPYNHQQRDWSELSQAPEAIIQTIKHSFRSTILPLERVLLDLHSGRFFGFIGVIIVDISGIFLILLSFSGCAIWFKHKYRSRKRRK